MKASRSELIVSASVVGMPCGKPDLVVLAVHDQHRDGDPPEVGREIGLPEGHDAVVVRWMTASEVFAPGRLWP